MDTIKNTAALIETLSELGFEPNSQSTPETTIGEFRNSAGHVKAWVVIETEGEPHPIRIEIYSYNGQRNQMRVWDATFTGEAPLAAIAATAKSAIA